MAVDADVGSLEAEVQALFAGRRLSDPFAVLKRLREEAPPVHRVGEEVYLTDFDDIRETLDDQEHYGGVWFAAGTRLEKAMATYSEENRRLLLQEVKAYEGKMIRLMDPDHERVKRIAMRFFTPRQVRRMEEFAREQWGQILDEAEAKGVYDHRAAAQDYALRIVTELAGAPQADREYLAGLMNIFSPAGSSIGNEQAWRTSYDAGAELRRYIDEEIIAAYRRDPASNEFVAAMMGAESEENLTSAEMVAMVDSVLLAGLETTSTFLTSLFLELLTYRDQWELLCNDPDLIPGAIEELLRFITPLQLIPRVATTTFEFRGVEIPEEQSVVCCVPAAHRDPRRYEDPDTLDVTRPRVQHLGFGYGFRYCVGASLVRMDIRVALSMLVERYPDAQLACDCSDLEWSGNPSIRYLAKLPISLGVRRR